MNRWPNVAWAYTFRKGVCILAVVGLCSACAIPPVVWVAAPVAAAKAGEWMFEPKKIHWPDKLAGFSVTADDEGSDLDTVRIPYGTAFDIKVLIRLNKARKNKPLDVVFDLRTFNSNGNHDVLIAEQEWAIPKGQIEQTFMFTLRCTEDGELRGKSEPVGDDNEPGQRRLYVVRSVARKINASSLPLTIYCIPPQPS